MHNSQWSIPLVSEYPSGPDASLFKGILFCMWTWIWSHTTSGKTINQLQNRIVVCYTVYEACMFRAAMVLACCGFLRVGEFTALSANKLSGRVLQLSDIAFKTAVSQGQQTKQVHVIIRYSKPDQRGRSTSTLVLSCLSEAKFKATCPFRTLEEYVSLRTPGVGQLFWHFDRSPLTRYQFSVVVKKIVVVTKH